MGNVNVVRSVVDAAANLSTGGAYGVAKNVQEGRPITASTLNPTSALVTGTAGQAALNATGIAGAVNKVNPLAQPPIPGLPSGVAAPTFDAEAAALEAADQEQAKKRAKAVVSTALTSPLGVSSGAPVQRSVLSSLGG